MAEEQHPSEEQGIEPEKSKEEKDLAMETGKKDEEVYDEEGRKKLTEDSEIEPWEEGFMEGAEGPGQDAKCTRCGKAIIEDQYVEKEIEGENKRFCSNHCVEEFEKEH